MKKLIALLLIYSQVSFAGLPPTSVKGQSDASSITKFNFQTPFSQNTDLGGISTLIETGNFNILPDPGFEALTSNWTTSGGTTATPNTSAKGTGLKGFDWDSSAAAQTMLSPLITIPEGFKGKNGTVSCTIKAVSGTATHTITANDGTNDIVQAQTISSSTSVFTDNKVNFVFPSSGSIRVKITSVASNEPEIYVDDCRLGLADNIGTVQQARLVGTVKITGCAGAWSTTSTTFTTFATQTGCSYAVTGEALAPTTNIPAVRFASLPPGEYKLEYEGILGQTTALRSAWFRFSDGTNVSREESQIYTASGEVDIPSMSNTIFYSTTQTNVTLQIQAKAQATSFAQIFGTTVAPGVIRVYYFPSSSQQIVSSAQTDYDWTSYIPTFTGFGTVTNPECQHQRVGPNLNLRCKFTTGASTATEARVSLPSGLSVADTTKVPSISVMGFAGSTLIPSNLSSTFTILGTANQTYLTFGLSQQNYSQALTSQNGNTLFNTSATVSLNATIPILGWSSNQRAPTLIGSVTSNSSGAERIERVTVGSVCNSSPCTITRQSGSWITSITRASTGVYTINIPAGTFSDVPTCNYSSAASNNVTLFRDSGTGTDTTTTLYLGSANAATAARQDVAFNIICYGPR